MPEWNREVFLLIDAPAHPERWVIDLVALLAGSPALVGPLVLVALWVWGAPSRPGELLSVAGAMLVGLGINQILGMLYFEPRPFMIELGRTLIAHAADNSFPSDHATFIWTLGAGLLATRAAIRTGSCICVYGLAVAWSRIFLGVHFPDDMAASAIVAVVSAGLARAACPLMIVWVLPAAGRLYEATVIVLRLPPALVPRHRPAASGDR